MEASREGGSLVTSESALTIQRFNDSRGESLSAWWFRDFSLKEIQDPWLHAIEATPARVWASLIKHVLHNFSFLLFTFLCESSASQSWRCEIGELA